MNNFKSSPTNLICQQYDSGHCQSCSLIKENYFETLKIKKEKLISNFPNDIFLKSVVGLRAPDRPSRNKAKLAVSENSLGAIEFGFFSSDGVFSQVEDCPLHLEGINNLLPVLRDGLLEFKIPAYDLKTKRGELKFVIITKTFGGEDGPGKQSDDQYLIRFILRSKEAVGRLNLMIKKMITSHPEIKLATVNIQSVHQAVLEGKEELILPSSTSDSINLKLNEIHLKLGPKSFLQVTSEIAAALYSKAQELISSHQIHSYLDLYCGVGAFSFAAAKSCSKVLGVEISQDAILHAQKAIPFNNGVSAPKFLAQDADRDFLIPSGFECIGVNPPRRGVGERPLIDILKNRPNFILYSSCQVETLKRDFDLLSRDYEIVETHLFDMFPWTKHFETLMFLKRKDFTNQ